MNENFICSLSLSLSRLLFNYRIDFKDLLFRRRLRRQSLTKIDEENLYIYMKYIVEKERKHSHILYDFPLIDN